MKFWQKKKKIAPSQPKHLIGTDPKSDLKLLIETCKKNLHYVNTQQVSTAFHWCLRAHKNKMRKSGVPYYSHPFSVAMILTEEIPLDDRSVISALLHNIPSSGELYSLKDIQSEFGTTVAEIVSGLVKIQHIEEQSIRQLENYRKLLLSLFRDVRIILIKLADRLHSMRTLDYLDEETQKRISKETMEIYAPFSQRFGLGNLKWEFEDLAFKYLEKETYNKIDKILALSHEEREEYIEHFTKPIYSAIESDSYLKKKNVKYEITGRAKHIYSIYNKTILRNKPVEELYDLQAIRVIVDSDETEICYRIHKVIAQLYRLVPDTYKDYIAEPKPNGYQSLHFAVYGKAEKMVEVQIRTQNMHFIAERGVAAHFNYKRGLLPAQSVLDDNTFQSWIDLVRLVFEHIGDEPPEELIKSVRKNLLQKEIYVFTKTNEFRVLPNDAYPLDFAYSIHTEIGNHCIGAKVNGKIVPLNYKLQSGDQIEILTSQTQSPNKEWLKYSITDKAQNFIKKYINDEKRKTLESGRELFKDSLNTLNISLNDYQIDLLIKHLHFSNLEEMLFDIGSNKIDRLLLLNSISNWYESNYASLKKNKRKEKEEAHFVRKSKSFHFDSSLPIKYAQCCYPLPDDEIIGILSEQMEIIVHRENCKKAGSELAENKSSVFNLEWSSLAAGTYTSKIAIRGEEIPSLIGDISSMVLSLDNTSIKGFNFDSDDKGFKGYILLSTENSAHLNKIIEKIGAVDGINSAERYIEE